MKIILAMAISALAAMLVVAVMQKGPKDLPGTYVYVPVDAQPKDKLVLTQDYKYTICGKTCVSGSYVLRHEEDGDRIDFEQEAMARYLGDLDDSTEAQVDYFGLNCPCIDIGSEPDFLFEKASDR